MLEMVSPERPAGLGRDRRLRVLAVEALADCAPVGERDGRVRGGHPADLGVERRDLAPPIGQPGAVRRRLVALGPGRGHRSRVRAGRARHDPDPEDDEDDRPELAPVKARQVQPERLGREEPEADDQDDHAGDHRGGPAVVGRRRAPGRRQRWEARRAGVWSRAVVAAPRPAVASVGGWGRRVRRRRRRLDGRPNCRRRVVRAEHLVSLGRSLDQDHRSVPLAQKRSRRKALSSWFQQSGTIRYGLTCCGDRSRGRSA